MREAFLDTLAAGRAGQHPDFREYRFADPEAQRLFDELMEHLREQVMGAYFRNMAEGLRNVSRRSIARFRDMLADLNDYDRAARSRRALRLRGLHAAPRASVPASALDARGVLLEKMARRMAAMSQLMASLTPEQRAEPRRSPSR